VFIDDHCVARVACWRDLSAAEKKAAQDLGDCILMPGLVNAHCHLDYTDMAGQFPPPILFTDWLKTITDTKADWSREDYVNSWKKGAAMLCRSGTTLVGDIEAVPQLLSLVRESVFIRVVSFIEMIGIRGKRPPDQIVREALDWIKKLRAAGHVIGLSPHAPYSTVPDLVRLSARAGSRRKLRLAMHVGESEVEYEMFKDGSGVMFDWLRRSGRDMTDCGGVTPVEHLNRCGALNQNTLAIHANYLGPADASLLARRRVSVVHCPRSHAYFQHARFRFIQLERAGVNICLGTDSLATVRKRRGETIELNMFEEMRAARAAEPRLTARKLVRMSTMNGAIALGYSGRAGELRPGAFADIATIPFSGKLSEVYEALVEHRGPVLSVMIDGRWVIANN
jgi:cytosine/adenosine deaminase-related metal-dependent hydrolase